MERVLRLALRQLGVQLAPALQVSTLDRGVRQQFDHFVDVGALTGFLEQLHYFFERARVVANLRDYGVQVAEELG